MEFIFKSTQMLFHPSDCASVPDFCDDSMFNPLFVTS